MSVEKRSKKLSTVRTNLVGIHRSGRRLTTRWSRRWAACAAGRKCCRRRLYDSHPTEVVNEVIDFSGPLGSARVKTKPFVELFQEFTLTTAQAMNEGQLGTCHTLAQMAAKSIALGEDTVIFQGAGGKLPAGVKADGIKSAGAGLWARPTRRTPTTTIRSR